MPFFWRRTNEDVWAGRVHMANGECTLVVRTCRYVSAVQAHSRIKTCGVLLDADVFYGARGKRARRQRADEFVTVFAEISDDLYWTLQALIRTKEDGPALVAGEMVRRLSGRAFRCYHWVGSRWIARLAFLECV